MKRTSVAISLVAGFIIGNAVVSNATPDAALITMCVNKKTNAVRYAPNGRCTSKERRLAWNVQGPAGVQGAVGPQGTQGLQGPRGSNGDGGAPGPQGVQGAVGPTGSIGPAGVAGPQGAQGVAGIAGPTGSQGLQGLIGLTGPAGTQGDVGAAGPQGIQGLTGPAGSQGSQGLTGPAGARGPGMTTIPATTVTCSSTATPNLTTLFQIGTTIQVSFGCYTMSSNWTYQTTIYVKAPTGSIVEGGCFSRVNGSYLPRWQTPSDSLQVMTGPSSNVTSEGLCQFHIFGGTSTSTQIVLMMSNNLPNPSYNFANTTASLQGGYYFTE